MFYFHFFSYPLVVRALPRFPSFAYRRFCVLAIQARQQAVLLAPIHRPHLRKEMSIVDY